MPFWKKKKPKKEKQPLPLRAWIILALGCGVIWFYTNSLFGVDPEVKQAYQALKQEMKRAELGQQLFVISGRRWAFDNWLLSTFGGASSQSQHLKGKAIDIIVLDINHDGQCNDADVDLVYQILDKKIIRDRGGIGTYKSEKGLLNRQMIHFDLRGSKARWHR
ncbi:MAG: hypothetical protein AAFV80_05005 [Bacteroidota bacterium]